jgi:hypothetical protein
MQEQGSHDDNTEKHPELIDNVEHKMIMQPFDNEERSKENIHKQFENPVQRQHANNEQNYT